MLDGDPDEFIRAARELNRALGWLQFTTALIAAPDVSRYLVADFARSERERIALEHPRAIAAMRLEWSERR